MKEEPKAENKMELEPKQNLPSFSQDNSATDPLQKEDKNIFREVQTKCKDSLLSIKKQLRKISTDFNKIIKEKSESYLSAIESYISDIAKNIEKSLDKKNIPKKNIEGVVNSTVEKVNNLINLQNDIFESIKQNYKLLVDLLSINTNYIKNFKNPNQVYITKNCEAFIKSWPLYNYMNIKINEEEKIKNTVKKLNTFLDEGEVKKNFFVLTILSKIGRFLDFDNLPDKYKEYVSKNSELGFIDLKLNNNNCSDEMKKYAKENNNIIRNITLIGVQSKNYNVVFDKKANLEIPTEPSSIYTTVNQINIKDSYLDEISFYDYFPNLEKIIAKNSKLKFTNILDTSNKLSKLRELYFINLNLTTKGFTNLIVCLNKNKELIDNLQILSAKKNKITKVVLFNEEEEILEQFNSLLELNLEDNNIFKYDPCNFNSTPEIKLINLTKNNISFSETYLTLRSNLKSLGKFRAKAQAPKEDDDSSSSNKSLLLIAKNSFLLKGEEENEYFNYLNSALEDFDYPMKDLTLSTLFNLYNKKLLFDIKFSPILKQSLQYINVSMCSLDNTDLIKFLNLCKDIFHLKKLNAGYNLLNEDFFHLYNENKLWTYFKQMEVFDFSDNEQIDIKNAYNDLFTFINNHQQLKKIEMSKTIFESLVGQFLKYKMREIKTKESIPNSINMRENYNEMESFIKNYETLNKGNCKFSFRELVPRANYDKIIKIAYRQLKPFTFKFKSS